MTSPVPTTSQSFPEILGYRLTEQLYLGCRTAVYRAVQTANQQPVVIKVQQQEYPSFSELVQFRNQYAIAKNLPIPGIVQPLSLGPLGSGYVLVMEDCGGVSLGRYIQQQPLGLTEVLVVACQIADILHDLIQHRVVHKDIKPANILIHPESKQVKLIDFSIASLLPKETQEIQSPNVLEGTLAYLAPEQTGRMNRGIDYRADFYALGVTLYQLLTDQLPFISDDPLELMHCHIAKVPVAADQVNPDVPERVAAIVAKLMAKNAEDRYQSAMGLKHDLKQCLIQWQETGEIAEFELGQRDLSDRFLIPEKLYGREAEVGQLLAAFERVADGASELMLISGFSGIGKTAVVNEVHKPIMRQRGYFIKGKFDQFNRNIPLSAFVQALRDLMGQLLSESDADLENWQVKILNAVGENGQVLIEVIPELEKIIGKQPIATELSGSAAQNRFNRLFQQFIEVFTTAEHPLVLFLDDLQWADLASLQLIQLLMNDNGYLLVLGTYRDNEVSPTHPFILTVDDLKKSGTIVETITLAPLAFEDTNHLIADTLNCSLELAQPLTELIDRKTQGNPFFTTQFLKALHEEGQIIFNQDRRYWTCDIAQVNALSITDDVVGFMALQLQKLPAETQQVLKLAACVGNQFDLTTLAIVLERSATDAATALWKALQEGLILPTSQVYKFFQGLEQADAKETANPAYRFLHDRIQQAAYSLIPEVHRATIHYRIGRLLLSYFSSDTQEERIFEIVGHLNLGSGLIVNCTERLDLVRLNLIAARKARTSTAYGAAVDYLATGIALLPQDAWESDYDLTLALHAEVADAAYLNTDFEQMEQWAILVLQQARTLLDTIPVQQIRLMKAKSQGKIFDALELGLQVLSSLGVELPLHPTQADIGQAFEYTRQLWQDQVPLNLLALPAMTDSNRLAAMQILSWLVSCAYWGNPALMALIIVKQVEFSIQDGNCPVAIYSYADYGLMLCGVMGDIPSGYDFGQLALQLLDELQVPSFKSRAWYVFYTYIQHWKAPLQASIPRLQDAFQIGLETGDLEMAGLNAAAYCSYAYHAGQELTGLVNEIDAYRQTIRQLKQTTPLHYLEIYQQTVLNLLAETKTPDQLMGTVFNPITSLPLLQAENHRTALFYFYFNQAVLSFLLGKDQQAVEASILTEQYLDGGIGTFMVPLYAFYDSLIQLALYRSMPEGEQQRMLERVAEHQSKLQGWTTLAPFNHEHRWELVEAKRYEVLGDRIAAIEFYDRAIASAHQNGFMQDEAIANELAAQFYLAWGKEKIAQEYLTNAYYGYVRWGAKAKVQDLERRYPQLLAPILQQQHMAFSATETVFATPSLASSQVPATQSFTSGSTSISATLDLETILKASQTLSSEIELDKLLATLLYTVLENSGADKGALLMPRDHQWFVEAVATVDQPAQVRSIALSSSSEVPQSLINRVKRSLEPVVIVDASVHPTLAMDAYVAQQQPKSLLCIPILNQGKPVAILYLENQITVGVFTDERIFILNILCTQAAISLTNSRFYQHSQEQSQYLGSLYDGVKHLIFVVDVLNNHDVRWSGWNRSTEEATGMKSTDISGKSPEEIFGSLEGKTVRQRMMNCLQAGTTISYEECLTFNDQLTWWQTTLNPLRDAKDRIYRIIGTTINITDLKLTETALRHSEAELQQKANDLGDAMTHLQQAQLQIVQSEKMASLGNLVAGIAHEINNPIGFLNGSINHAKGYVQDLLGHLALYQQHHPNPASPVQDNAEDIDLEYLSEDLPNLLDSMNSATDRIKGISTSLRTFSRADTEHKVSANLHDGIDSTILILKYRLKANEHRPAIEVIQNYGDIPPIECFPGQLNQVFMNLLANAIDIFDEMAQQSSFTELKSNPQKITIYSELIQQNAIEIRIVDNGKGMSETVKSKIFDHLFTTKGVGKGTGLGLAIARQIVVEKHGGSLEVQSEVGQGTEFCIRLPIVD